MMGRRVGSSWTKTEGNNEINMVLVGVLGAKGRLKHPGGRLADLKTACSHEHTSR